ncbi:hypothetical protein G7067_05245 [Leucobacter insecticola]|uniref:Uncharacterized protein n=1 Tax=Leucobacter insecticola TaxID=2714934 RepID=A0A6G8FI46_9MICO|nr:hypothetical protein [Leucobacter insecticola]QIM15959.1 hypothetical protein G7067_05245 [Leucobacter insecticola]
MTSTLEASFVPDFMEEEEYEAAEVQQPTIKQEPQQEASADLEAIESQPAKDHRSTVSGRRITEGNARLLAFVAKFPGADSEAFSVVSARNDKAVAGRIVLPTVKGTKKRLLKMEQLGAVARYRDTSTRTVHYSATQQGIDALWSFGYSAEHAATLNKISKSRAAHYRYIAHVAAQFASPQGYFRDSLGIEPVALECLISENEMRAHYEPVKQKLKEAAKRGESKDFGRWRKNELEASLTEASQGKILWSDITESRPALLTLGQPQRAGTETKAVHQGDLAVIRDADRDGVKARNILVEVELSKKSWDAYNSILKTLKMELDHGFIYERAVYFTVGPQVENLLKKVDARGGYGLFESGKLIVLPILDRDGTPIRFNNRISLGGI